MWVEYHPCSRHLREAIDSDISYLQESGGRCISKITVICCDIHSVLQKHKIRGPNPN